MTPSTNFEFFYIFDCWKFRMIPKNFSEQKLSLLRLNLKLKMRQKISKYFLQRKVGAGVKNKDEPWI